MFSLLFFYLNLLCCSFHFAHFVFFFFAFWLFFPLVIYCRVVFSTYLLIQRTDVSVDYDETLIFHSKFRARKLRELTWKSRPPAHPRVIFFVDGKPRSGILLEKEGWGEGGGGWGRTPLLTRKGIYIGQLKGGHVAVGGDFHSGLLLIYYQRDLGWLSDQHPLFSPYIKTA